MSFSEMFHSDKYDDGRTKQSFKDTTDINKILAKAAKGDAISHLAKHGAVYGDFTDIDDLLTAYERLQRGQEIFQELPGEVRREFHNDAGRFFRYVNDPKNSDRLAELIPALAAPGNDMPEPLRRAESEIGRPDTPAPDTPPAAPAAENPPGE